MKPLPAQPLRVIIYIFASSKLFDGSRELQERVRRECLAEGFDPVEIYVDRGPPKTRFKQYPALLMMDYGSADALVVVRSPMYQRDGVSDWLESQCPEGPFVCLGASELRARRILPPLIADRRRERKAARKHKQTVAPTLPQPVTQRATALHAQGLSVRQISQILADEGHPPPSGAAAWSIESVAQLLGLRVLEGGAPAGG